VFFDGEEITMWFYQYVCEANGQVIEVRHSASVRLQTWGEVCRQVGMDVGQTSPDAKVTRLVSVSMPFTPRLKGIDKDAPSKKLEL